MLVDFRFSPEGDLELGAPHYNEEGELLYVDPVGETSTNEDDGELVRDIPLRYSVSVEKQIIINRLRTDNPDWRIHPEIGANLSDLIGQPNTRETGKAGEQMIVRCLTHDGFIAEGNLEVRGVPVSKNEILFRITKQHRVGELVVPVVFNLSHGLLTEYEVNS